MHFKASDVLVGFFGAKAFMAVIDISADDCTGNSTFKRSVTERCQLGGYVAYVEGMASTLEHAVCMKSGTSDAGYILPFPIHSSSIHSMIGVLSSISMTEEG